VIFPHLKDAASPNKGYGADNWGAVVARVNHTVYQAVQEGDDIINGTIPVKTKSLGAVLGLVAGASCVITNEGGGHHMAAAYRVPAVVYAGGFTPKECLSYGFHVWFGVSGKDACGLWKKCAHCDKIRAETDPSDIALAVNLIMEQAGHG
jgi:ADP-heptose:LPS heptosyltransferase